MERKLDNVKSSDMVGLLRRLKAKLRILEEVKKNRIRELKKKDAEYRRIIASKKLMETLKKGDERKEMEAKKKKTGKMINKILLSSIKATKCLELKSIIDNSRRTFQVSLARVWLPGVRLQGRGVTGRQRQSRWRNWVQFRVKTVYLPRCNISGEQLIIKDDFICNTIDND